MVAAIAVLYVPLYLVGYGLQSALGLEEGEMLTEAGAWGLVAAVALAALVAAPQVVGVVLGVRARRLGDRRLGTAGIVVNAAVGLYLLVAQVTHLVLA